jgi:hypothetical protein
MTVNKSAIRRGRAFERKIAEYFRDRDFEVEHNRLVGQDDEGDVSIRTPQFHILVEAKSPGPGKPIRIPEWLRQAHLEAEHYAAKRRLDINNVVPVVMIERVGEGMDEAWVCLKLSQFAGGAV